MSRIASGPPGTGKSTLSYRLARHTGWAVLAIDQLDRTLNEMGFALLLAYIAGPAETGKG